MQIDQTQASTVYALLSGILDAISAGDADDATRMTQAARDVMTGLPVEDARTNQRKSIKFPTELTANRQKVRTAINSQPRPPYQGPMDHENLNRI